MTNTNLEELIGRLEADLKAAGPRYDAEVSNADLRAAITRLREMEEALRLAIDVEERDFAGKSVELREREQWLNLARSTIWSE